MTGVAEPTAAIRITDLGFRYEQGDFDLRIPELTVRQGERIAVIGPSGSGKTTLLHLMAGIVEPEHGSVVTAGVEVSNLEDARRRDFRIRRIGLVFQEFELIDYLSVLDNILLPYRINPILRLDDGVRKRALDLARRVGIEGKLGRLATRLSHGEKQRAAVCRALIANPEILLADEPTGNLDPVNKGRVLDILIGYAEEREATLITVTHDRELLERFGRVIDFKTFQSGATESGGGAAS